ncbi:MULTISPECIES: transposase domain-containing protein [Vibrio]|uniref:transposase domain-containing protein n=1 Tax=Vibrio TaxID=662 RepID=UPI003755181E|nr:transposase domain-containing protein [Vibrio parahaemolyticus]
MLTCRANNVEPYAYLRYILTELPQREELDSDVSDLLPYNNRPAKARWVEVPVYVTTPYRVDQNPFLLLPILILYELPIQTYVTIKATK